MAKAKKEKATIGSVLLRFFIAFSVTLAVLFAAGAGLYAYVFSDLETEAQLSDSQAGIEEQEHFHSKITNIALFGIDSANKEMKGRSDSIVIVSVDEEREEIRLSAIERDTRVRIQYTKKDGTAVDKMDKINHAFSYGGAELAVKTLNQNFDLDIRHYAVVDFSNMMKVIDELGGIRMEVPEKYIKETNKLIRELSRGQEPDLIEESGEQLLSGVQVLSMARVRKSVGGTNVRASMHEKILSACFDRIKEKSIVEYPTIAKNLLALVQTTLDAENITKLATKVVGYSMEQEVFPLEMDWLKNNMINGVWYRTWKEEEGKAHLIDYIYRDILPAEAKK